MANVHNKVDAKRVVVESTVTALDPLQLACRDVMSANVTGRGPTTISTSIGDIPGSGYTTELRNGQAQENTPAKTQTMTCLPSPHITISNPDKRHEVVTIDETDIQLFTRYVEDQTTVVTSPKPLAAAGEAIGSALNLLSFGHAKTYMPLDERMKAEAESFTRQVGVNTVEKQCATQAWDQTRLVIEESYRQEADQIGIGRSAVSFAWIGARPDFKAPYSTELNNGDLHAKAEDFAVNNCTVAGDVSTQVSEDASIYRAPQLAEIK